MCAIGTGAGGDRITIAVTATATGRITAMDQAITAMEQAVTATDQAPRATLKAAPRRKLKLDREIAGTCAAHDLVDI